MRTKTNVKAGAAVADYCPLTAMIASLCVTTIFGTAPRVG